MNRQWMYGSRTTTEFIEGLNNFIDVAKANKQKGFISCPTVRIRGVLFFKKKSPPLALVRFHAQL